MAFLDETGLARFWNRVQGYVSTNIQRNNTSLAQAFGERLVSKTTTINNKPLTGNITLSYSDVRAAAASHNHDTVYVRKENYNESIAGTKTFTGQVVISGTHNDQDSVGLLITGNPTNYACSIQDTGYTKGTLPDTAHYWTYGDAYGTARTTTSDRVGMVESSVNTAGLSSIYISAYGVGATNTGTRCTITANVDASGNAYTAAPTPAVSDSSTKIATTAWVRTATGNFACNAASATKLGTTNLGDGNTPIYLSAGTPTAFTATVGTTSRPIWLNAGSLVVCNATVGSASKPVYMNAGTITALSATVGNANTPVYLNAGTITSTGKSFANYLPLAGGTITGTVLGTANGVGFKVENGDTKTCSLLRGSTYVGLYDSANGQWVTRVAAEKAYIHYGTVSAVSDKRNKKNITSVPESLLDAWGNIDWVQFEYKNLVNDKINIGLVAQDVEEKLNEKGINASDYPFFEHEIWEKDEEHMEAGDQYFIHYTEALAIEAAYMRRYAKQLENRIAELEAKVNVS